MLVLSETSNTSPQVSREVERAASRGLPIVPFRVSNVELSKEMEYFVSDRHWLDAVTPPLEQHLQKLALTVRALLDVADRDLPVRPTATERAGAPELPTYRLQRSMRPWAQRGLVPAAIIVAALVVVGTGGLFLWRTTQAPPSAAVLELTGGPAAVNSSPAAPVAVAVSSPSQGLAGATSTPATQPASNPAPSPIATQRFGPLTQSLTQDSGSVLLAINFGTDHHIPGRVTRFENFDVRPYALKYGPQSRSIQHSSDPQEVNFAYIRPPVQVQDFVFEATFDNPYAGAEHGWDDGFFFRSTGAYQNYWIWFDSNGAWSCILLQTGSDPIELNTGSVAKLNTGAGQSNTMRVIALGSVGYFFVNDVFVDRLDLSRKVAAGDAGAGIGMADDDKIAGRVTSVANYLVASLD